MCAVRELEEKSCTKTFLKRCTHETEKFNAWNNYRFQPFSWGKYGAIGKLSLNGVRVKIGDTSLIVKTNRKPINEIKIKFHENVLTLDENVAEIVFAAIIKILYDSGACPFYVRYAGYFLKQPLIYLFSEKCCFEFSHILERQQDGFCVAQRVPNLLMNCIFQFVYAVYIYKSYFNLIHFDTHIRNIMLKTRNSESYGGIRWSECKYIVFRDARLRQAIVIKNYGYTVKILDFGLCFATLGRTPVAASNVHIRSNINAEMCVDTPSKSNTLDLMYFLLHIYQYMNFGLDKNFGSTTTQFSKDRAHFSTLLQQINDFSKFFFGNAFSHFANANVPDRNSEGKLLYLLKNHNVGIESPLFDHCQGLMEGLLRVCREAGFVRDNCDVAGSEGFTVYSHEAIEDFVFNPKHCIVLDAGVAMDEKHDICAASVQWWSTGKFEDACRSKQKFTPDCNIMLWRLQPVDRRSSEKKQLVISARSATGPCPVLSVRLRSHRISLENTPLFSKEYSKYLCLKRQIFHKGHEKQIFSDSYKKRNFVGIDEEGSLFILCFGNYYGEISVTKACKTFRELHLHDVFEWEDSVDIFVKNKNRKTRIVLGNLENSKSIFLTVEE
jgi:hypothetical protein